MSKTQEALKLALEALEICSVRQEHQWQGLQKMQMAEHALREALAEQPAQQEQNRQIDQLIHERDHRDEIIDKLCDAALGPDRYEWSSQYFFEDAVREVEERMAEQPAQQERTDYAVHLNHCNIGEYEGVCKYLDDDCPALKHADMKAKWDSPTPQPAQQEPVAKPYAYEYGRDNGDGTYSVVIEKGDLVQTAPAVYNYVRPRNAHKDWPIKELFDHPPAQRDIRNATLDEIATKIGAMPFGDTAASFAVWIREQKT